MDTVSEQVTGRGEGRNFLTAVLLHCIFVPFTV